LDNETTHERIVINVSREADEPDIAQIASAVTKAITGYQLGATFTRTLGAWEGVLEQGVEIKITYPLRDHWAQAGADAEKDTLFVLQRMLPAQRFFQVERERVWMGEWETSTRRFT